MNHKQKILSHIQRGKLRGKKEKTSSRPVMSGLQLYPGLTDGPSSHDVLLHLRYQLGIKEMKAFQARDVKYGGRRGHG